MPWKAEGAAVMCIPWSEVKVKGRNRPRSNSGLGLGGRGRGGLLKGEDGRCSFKPSHALLKLGKFLN